MCDHNYRWLNALWWVRGEKQFEMTEGQSLVRISFLLAKVFIWDIFYQWVVLRALLFWWVLMVYSGICVWRDKWIRANYNFFFLNRFQCLVNTSKDKHLLMLTTVRLPKLESALKWCIVVLAVFYVPKLENKQHFLSLQQHETIYLNTGD